MRYTLEAISLIALTFASVAGASEQFTIVIHARTPGGTGSCTAAGLPDCINVRPTIQIAGETGYRFYIFVNNYNDIQGLQTAFAWPSDWMFGLDGEPEPVYPCRTNQVSHHIPHDPGGPNEGIYATTFDCFVGPGLAVIGRMDFLVYGTSGCLTQLNPNRGSGRVEILDCENRSYRIDASDPVQRSRLGSICAGTPGHDACDPLSTPIEPATWGRIKASYAP
jgi:hypothetical protein